MIEKEPNEMPENGKAEQEKSKDEIHQANIEQTKAADEQSYLENLNEVEKMKEEEERKEAMKPKEPSDLLTELKNDSHFDFKNHENVLNWVDEFQESIEFKSEKTPENEITFLYKKLFNIFVKKYEPRKKGFLEKFGKGGDSKVDSADIIMEKFLEQIKTNSPKTEVQGEIEGWMHEHSSRRMTRRKFKKLSGEFHSKMADIQKHN